MLVVLKKYVKAVVDSWWDIPGQRFLFGVDIQFRGALEEVLIILTGKVCFEMDVMV